MDRNMTRIFPAREKQKLFREIDRDYRYLEDLYRHLHSHPELSGQEIETSRRMAEELGTAGFDVTSNIGGHGVAAVLENGRGPKVMIRADMDALPVREETGLPYASQVTAKDASGQDTGVMHACGHDVHMTVQVGAARLLAGNRRSWRGTLIVVAQPAEETLGGADAMIADGLFVKIPRPDYVLGLHVMNLPAGMAGSRAGYWFAGVTALDVTIRGMGGHGAHPHQTKDPVVIAAQTILALQTIVSREVDPLEPAVVTVGAIHGGTRGNIIPGEVCLQLNIRAFPGDVRERMTEAARRIAEGIARSAGLPEELMPSFAERCSSPALYNDPGLTARITDALREVLGKGCVVELPQYTAAEDFALFAYGDPPIPICLFGLGAADPTRSDRRSPPLHSSRFAPVPEATIKSGVKAMASAVFALSGT